MIDLNPAKKNLESGESRERVRTNSSLGVKIVDTLALAFFLAYYIVSC